MSQFSDAIHLGRIEFVDNPRSSEIYFLPERDFMLVCSTLNASNITWQKGNKMYEPGNAERNATQETDRQTEKAFCTSEVQMLRCKAF